MLNARLFRFWHDLPEALRTGKPQNEVKHSGSRMFEELYSDLPRLEQFMGAMTGLSRINFEAFAEKFDFTPFKTLCDVGGATGLLCMEVAKRHPHLRCTSFDLPVGRADREEAHRARPDSPVASRTAAGDFFKDPLPKADVITMGMILHDWNLEKKMHLIRAAYDALPPGGAFVAIEALIDDDRRENVFGLMMSLNMLIEFGDAFDYTGADFRGWCGEVGLQAVRGHPPRRAVERGGGVQVAVSPWWTHPALGARARLPLAPRAVEALLARLHYAGDGCAAARARFAFAAVDRERVLEVAELAVRLAVVAERRPAGVDGVEQHCAHGGGEGLGLARRHVRRQAQRRDARPPERLGEIDVAEPGHQPLVAQRRLDRRAPPGQPPTEILAVETVAERLRPQAGQEPVRV